MANEYRRDLGGTAGNQLYYLLRRMAQGELTRAEDEKLFALLADVRGGGASESSVNDVGSAVIGSGAANQVTLWKGVREIQGNATLTYLDYLLHLIGNNHTPGVHLQSKTSRSTLTATSVLYSGEKLSFTSVHYWEQDVPWTNPSNASADDDDPTTISDPHPYYLNSQKLIATINANTDIPATATITGYKVLIKRKACVAATSVYDPQYVADSDQYLILDGEQNGENWFDIFPEYVFWPDAYENYELGASDNVWGALITPAQIRNGQVGFMMAVNAVGDTVEPLDYSVDFISIEVFYTYLATTIVTKDWSIGSLDSQNALAVTNAATPDATDFLFNANGSLTIPATTGTAPFVIGSTTAVSNLNADLLDGSHAAAFSLAMDSSNPTTIAPSDAAAPGAATAPAHRDHTHGAPATWPPAAHNVLSHGDALSDTIARGDLLVGNATPKLARLTIGANGYLLTSNGTDPSWQPAPASGISGSIAATQIAYGASANAIAGSNALVWSSGSLAQSGQVTDPANLYAGIKADPSILLTADNANTYKAMSGSLTLDSCTYNPSIATGLGFSLVKNSSGTLAAAKITDLAITLNAGTTSQATGMECLIATSGAAIATAIDGFWARMANGSTNHVGSFAGFRVLGPVFTSSGLLSYFRGLYYNAADLGGKVGYAYAIYLDSVSGALAGNYAIYTNGGLVRLGDQLAIEASADRQQLVVTGHSTQTLAPAQISRADAAAGIASTLALTGLGSGAIGDGISIDLSGKSATTAARQLAKIAALWTTATDATRTSDIVLSNVLNGVEQEALRLPGAAKHTLTIGSDRTLTIPATGTAALGTGAASQLAYWSGTNALTSSAYANVDLSAQGGSSVGQYVELLNGPSTINPIAALSGRGLTTIRSNTLAGNNNNGFAENNILAFTASASGQTCAGQRYLAMSGTYDAPDKTKSGHGVFVGFCGHDGSNYVSGSKAIMLMTAAADWSATSQPTYISFGTTPSSSTTRAERMRIDSNGDIFLGGTTNAVVIATGGELTLAGSATRFLDEKGQLAQARVVSPGAKIVQDDAEGAYYFKDSATTSDYLWVNIQFNHDRLHGATVSPHLHWWQTSSTIPNWLLQYRWQKQGAAKTTAWTSVKWSSHAFTYTSGTLNQITDYTDITPPSGDGISAVLQIRIIRDTANASTLFAGADGLTGDVYAYDFDVHKEIDTMGSSQEYVK